VLHKVVLPMVISPLVGFALSYLFMVAILWAFRRANAVRSNRGFRWAQVVSAATMAFGHGTQDAQKTMGVIALTLVVSGHLSAHGSIPLWVILACAVAISAGTYSGGWRIMRTLGRRIFTLSPASGFAAQTVGSGVLLAAAGYGLPISTTHVISSSIMGAGATRRLSAVRWGVAGNIVMAWVLTIPAAAAVAALVWAILHAVLSLPKLVSATSRAERLDQGGGEGVQVVRLAAGDQGETLHRAAEDLLVAPLAAGIADIGPQAGPTGQGLALHHAGLDQGPWAVADRGDRFARLGKGLDEADRLRHQSQLVRIADPAGQHQAGVVSRIGIGDRVRGLEGVGQFGVVVHRLHGIPLRRDQHRLPTGFLDRLPRPGEFDLLHAAVGDQERDSLSCQIIAHSRCSFRW